MTAISEVLQRAAEVHPPIDVQADLARGRTYARRRRTRTAAMGATGAVAASAVVAAVIVGHGAGSDQTGPRGVATQPPHAVSKTAHPRVHHHAYPNQPAPHRAIRAATIDPGTLTTTRYFLVPPAPAGWHLVGTTVNYVMVARDGTQPPLEGGFAGHLMVGLTAGAASYPETSGSPVDFDGRVFWQWEDSGNTLIAVRDRNHDWLIAQYPESAGFELNAMVAYLDAVRPLAGTVTAG